MRIDLGWLRRNHGLRQLPKRKHLLFRAMRQFFRLHDLRLWLQLRSNGMWVDRVYNQPAECLQSYRLGLRMRSMRVAEVASAP